MEVKHHSLPSSYTCKCGKINNFTAYVFAHWDTPLVAKCDCGREHNLLRGKTRQIKGPTKKVKVESN